MSFRIGRSQELVVTACGSSLELESGNVVFDFTSAWNVMNAGWGNKQLADHAKNLVSLPFAPDWCPKEADEDFRRAFTQQFPGYHVIYGCTGAGAVEAALLIGCIVTGRQTVISIKDSYHGSSLGLRFFQGRATEVLPSIKNDNTFDLTLSDPSNAEVFIEELQNVIRRGELPAVILLEALPTNNGAYCYDERVFTTITDLSKEFGFLVVCDEVGTGVNRTGSFTAAQRLGLQPDITVFGKAMTNGFYPLSVVAYHKSLFGLFDDTIFPTTYAGTPFGLGMATKALELHEALKSAEAANSLGDEIRKFIKPRIRNSQEIIGIDGLGLELSLRLNWEKLQERTTIQELESTLIRRGVFCAFSDAKNDLMLMPPLTSNKTDTLKALDKTLSAFN